MTATFNGGLGPTVIDQLRNAGSARTYAARSYVFYEGDPGTSVYVIESGLMRIDKTTRHGRVVLLDLASRGALIGEVSVIDGGSRSATLSTVTECVVHHISAGPFRQLVQRNSAVQDAVMKRLTERLRGLSTQFLETSTMDAPARMASCIVRLVEIEQSLGRAAADRNGLIDLKLPISQEEMGQWAGLGREGAVKGLATLRSVGVIETGRKRVRIIDLAELQRLSGNP